MNEAWRTLPSGVTSAYRTSATSSGLTQAFAPEGALAPPPLGRRMLCVKGRRLDLEPGELLPQRSALLGAPACADAPGRTELPLIVVDAEEEAADFGR